MKKVLSVILSTLLLLSVVSPVVMAGEAIPTKTGSQIPLIYISGDAEPIYNSDGEIVLQIGDNGLLDLFSDSTDEEEGGTSNLLTSVANVLMPFLIQGLLNDDWDPYYENLEKEVGELFEKGRLDDNGEAPEGTGVSAQRQSEMQYDMTHDKKGKKGYYGLNDYHFWYDWRLDPLVSAESLHEYVQSIKETTHSEKVGIASACLGSAVVLAYISLYGTDDFVGVGMAAPLVKGSEAISEAISGKFHLDMDATSRILADTETISDFNIPSFLYATLDLLSKTGIWDRLSDSMKERVYYKIVEGATSALTLSTLFTFPCYWSCVAEEDYDDALHYVFGDEGSEKREKYAGLIEKIENYHEQVAVNVDDLMTEIVDDGLNLAILVKTGFQILPICQSNDVVGDQYTSASRASFGATTSTIYDTLSDEYIAAREEEGLGKYISPDKQIDASTCLFPDYTWFTKNSTHTERCDSENRLLYTVVTADHQLTVDDFAYTQFMVLDPETDTTEAMTEENCHTEHWTEESMQGKPENKYQKIFRAVIALLRWLYEVLNLIMARTGK